MAETKPEPGSPLARAGLYRKIGQVAAKVERVPKSGENTYFHYRYALESDITDAIRGIMAEVGLAFLPPTVLSWERSPTVKKGRNGEEERGDDLTRVQYQFGLADCDSGETFESVWWAEGQDSSDKGFNKAATSASKYWLLKTFMIATGDDPDASDSEGTAQATAGTATPAPPPVDANAPRCPRHSKYPARLTKDGTSYYCSFKATPAEGGNERGYCTWTAPATPTLGPTNPTPQQQALSRECIQIAEAAGMSRAALRAYLEGAGLLSGQTLKPEAPAALRAWLATQVAEQQEEIEATEAAIVGLAARKGAPKNKEE